MQFSRTIITAKLAFEMNCYSFLLVPMYAFTTKYFAGCDNILSDRITDDIV